MPEGLQHEAVSLRSGGLVLAGAQPVQGRRTRSSERYTAAVFGEKLQCRGTAKLRHKHAGAAYREELARGAASFRTAMTPPASRWRAPESPLSTPTRACQPDSLPSALRRKQPG